MRKTQRKIISVSRFDTHFSEFYYYNKPRNCIFPKLVPTFDLYTVRTSYIYIYNTSQLTKVRMVHGFPCCQTFLDDIKTKLLSMNGSLTVHNLRSAGYPNLLSQGRNSDIVSTLV